MPDGTDGAGLVAYFGYGSLVNRATHRTEIVAAVPARLKGWRRCWRPGGSGARQALLSVRRDPGAVCEGLLVVDRAENLPAVDERERGYRRVALTGADLALDGAMPDCPVHVYEALAPEPAAGLHTIQSYLDAVLQGIFGEYGEAGVRRFMAQTEDFDLAVMADRAAPLYPRAVALEEAERSLFDALLQEHGMRFAPAQG